MWPRRRNRAASAAILLLFHAFAGGHARRGHDGLVRCLGKGDASAMAVAATTRFSGRAFWVTLGATSDRARMDRHCRRAGEAPDTVRRLRES